MHLPPIPSCNLGTRSGVDTFDESSSRDCDPDSYPALAQSGKSIDLLVYASDGLIDGPYTSDVPGWNKGRGSPTLSSKQKWR